MNRSQGSILGFGALLLAAVFACMMIVTPGSAQAPAADQKPAAKKKAQRHSFLISRDVPDAATVARGKKVFVSNCGFCHGASARGGDSGPDLVRSVLALRDEGGNLIGPVIRKGFPDKGMPAFPLTDEQITDIAAFIRFEQQAAINRNNYEIQNVVTGDPAKGKAYFNGAGGCAKCHSISGDLQGVASKYDAVALQSRFLYPGTRRFRPAGGTEPKPTTVTVTTGGQTIEGTLVHVDDFNVALRDSSGDYHSFTRGKNVKVEIHDPLEAHIELLGKYSDADVHNILAYLVTLK